jgi:hypothetical protein
MKRRQGYTGFVIEARSHELEDGGFSTEFSVEGARWKWRDSNGVLLAEYFC